MLETKYLFDIATRHQLYVEGVKISMYRDLQTVLAELSKELRVLFARLQYRNLDALNKGQLNRLIVALRQLQSRVFGTYAGALIKQIQAFMNASLSVTKRQFVGAFNSPYGVAPSEEDSDEFIAFWVSRNRMSPLWGVAAITTDPKKLWATIRNLPIPANGVPINNFTSSFSVSAQGRIENLVRQAWANGITVDELLENLTGTPGGNLGGMKQGSSSQIDRIFNQGAAVIDTEVQFVSQVVSAAVGSSMFAKYVWNSVIDNATTDICRHRDGKIYEYVTGPRPPAHVRCRSAIAPVGADLAAAAAMASISLGEWLASQPRNVQEEFADSYKNGTYSPRLLTVGNFERKLQVITAR